MQAYYELEADIPVDHRLNIVLPDTIPVGKAKMTVIYEVGETVNTKSQTADAKPKNLTDFFGVGKDYSRFTTVKEIDDFIAENREVWDN